MKEDNIEGERKILKKHRKYAKNYLNTPDVKNLETFRLNSELKAEIISLEDYYVRLSEGSSKDSRSYIREISRKKEVKHSQSFLFGGWVGICLTVIVMLIIVLELSDVSVEKDPIFSRDFPTWRGIAYFIFYMWIISLNTYLF